MSAASAKTSPTASCRSTICSTTEKLDPVPPLERERQANAAAHVAAITFDVGEDGLVPVARNHLELLAGGLGVCLESRIGAGAVMLSTIAPSSFAGVSLTLLPWLLTGGTLFLHHPFDAELFAAQRHDERCGTLILPGPVALPPRRNRPLRREGPAPSWPNGVRRNGSWELAVASNRRRRWSMSRSSARPAWWPAGAAKTARPSAIPFGAAIRRARAKARP